MNFPKLIAFSGRMASGKDTYGKLYKELLEENSLKYKHYSFATPLKNEVDKLIELTKKNYTPKCIAEIMNCNWEEAIYAMNIINKELQYNNGFNAYMRTKGNRTLLQYWGTDVRRNKDKNYWVNQAEMFIREYIEEGYYIYITDARYLNEFSLISRLGGTLVKLDCSKEVSANRIFTRDKRYPTKEEQNHSSEIDFTFYNDFDGIIDTERLYPNRSSLTNLLSDINKL